MVEEVVDGVEDEDADLDECILPEVHEASAIAEHRLAAQHLEVALQDAPMLRWVEGPEHRDAAPS